MQAIKVYIASKTRHAEKWKTVRAENSWGENVQISSRWIDESALGAEHTLSDESLADVWKRNLEDIMHSDLVVVYAAAEDILRGALVEVGAALSWEMPIIACGIHVGKHHDLVWGSWQFHPLVRRIKQEHQIWYEIKAIVAEWAQDAEYHANRAKPEGGN